MRKYARMVLLIIAELAVIGFIAISFLVNRREPVVLSPEITAWQ